MENQKRENFKFSMRTINNIQALLDLGLVRNKTEAIDIALEHFVTEEKTKLLYQVKGSQTPRLGETPIHANNAMFDIAHILDATAQY